MVRLATGLFRPPEGNGAHQRMEQSVLNRNSIALEDSVY